MTRGLTGGLAYGPLPLEAASTAACDLQMQSTQYDGGVNKACALRCKGNVTMSKQSQTHAHPVSSGPRSLADI